MAKCIEETCSKQAIFGEYLCSRHKAFNRAGRPMRPKKSERYPWHKLYSTAKWARLRMLKLSFNPLCELCGDVGKHIDHIVPHKGDQRLFYKRANLQTLCIPCHTKKTNAERWIDKLAKAPYKVEFTFGDIPSDIDDDTIFTVYGQESKLIFVAKQMAMRICLLSTRDKKDIIVVKIDHERSKLQYQTIVEAQALAKNRIEAAYV